MKSLAGWTRANAVFLLLIFLLGTWVAESTAFTSTITYLPAATWLLPGLVLAIVCAIAKKRTLLAANLATLAVGGWLLMGLTVPTVFHEIEGQRFTLLTYNIHHATVGWERIRELIEEHQPYLVCLQEADQIDHKDTLVKSFPGYQIVHQDGLVIACRDSLSNVRRVPLAYGTRDALEATAGNGVTVVTAQLASFTFSKFGPLGLPGHIRAVAEVHRIQVDRFVEEYGGKPDCLIAGDFNGPPRGQVYRTMTSRFTDAFAQRGWGFGYTYPSGFPLVRIDYAFTTDIKPLSAEVLKTTLSDHRPVLFEMLLYRPT